MLGMRLHREMATTRGRVLARVLSRVPARAPALIPAPALVRARVMETPEAAIIPEAATMPTATPSRCAAEAVRDYMRQESRSSLQRMRLQGGSSSPVGP